MSEPKAIPKFGSFRPKVTPPVNDQENKSSSREKADAGEKEKKKHSHRHHRHRSRSRERHHQTTEAEASHLSSSKRGRSRSRERDHQVIEAKFFQPPKGTREESPDLFFIDRKGDEKNIAYGSIHRYSVPAFYRIGAGNVLGAPTNLKINRNYGDEKEIVLNDWRNSISSSREKYIFSRVAREKPRLLKIRPEHVARNAEDSSEDFVSLNQARGKKRKRTGQDGGESSASENDETHYRSIHGKSKPKNQPEDEGLQYATESESSGSETGFKLDSDAPGRQRNVQLGQKVEQDPRDIDAWLALIEHQDTLLRGQDDRRRITNAEIRSTADIKIHMYEKALEKAGSLKDRERLLLGLMAEGSKIWEAKTQSDRWEQISKDNIDSLMLWKSFLNFKQATFSTFLYEQTRDICLRRMKLLSKAASTASSDTINSIYQQILYVLLRLTFLMRESGYSELSVAIWQGLLEVNFRAPKNVCSKEESLRQFGTFWESEVGRIGDDDARGWRHFVENQVVPETDALVAEMDGTLDNANLFQSWAASERSRCKDSLLPARTMDDVVEDDPFRVILFSDVEDFLVILPPNSEQLQKSLLDGFLIFCRLPPLSAIGQPAQDKLTDAFVRDELLELSSTWISSAYKQKARDGSDEFDISSTLDAPISAFQSSPDTIFATSHWFKNIRAWRELYDGDPSPVCYKWVRNTLNQLTQAYFREDLTEYYLAFEWRNEPDTIKKISKSVLKQHPSSLKLYNSYAMIEWTRGNKDAANGVLSAALNMSNSMSENDKRDSILLWKTWIWARLEDLDKASALQHLLSIVDVLPIPQFAHLRRLFLRLGNTLYQISEAQGDIATALLCYTSLSNIFIDRNLSGIPSHELLLQSAARLLFHHARIGPFRPAFLREHLSNFITLFPKNTIFLSLYTWNEARLRIDNRVRNILLSTVLTPENDSLTSRLFAIYYEINHGTIHSARSAFEHALSTPASQSSAGLWKFYIIYSLETPQFHSHAKDIWYRALRACPWAKELYIFGFEKLSGGLVSFEELKRTWRVMGEKELRVHVDLEDSFEEIAELEQSEKGHKRLGFRGAS
ncbi:Protein NRDE2-like protein [Lachnellula suecica]|uniref:Protein NRDE2-like protein n=1 Tax=Lachnellula suecica TaxID=602035 RepID=A0A8T9C9C2_9HELO|nr:Protein NRDE2-like protein [Lachnellula suecica]